MDAHVECLMRFTGLFGSASGTAESRSSCSILNLQQCCKACTAGRRIYCPRSRMLTLLCLDIRISMGLTTNHLTMLMLLLLLHP